MANIAKVNGFRPSQYLSGAKWNGQVRTYYVPAADATALFAGDLVKAGGSADANGVQSVTQATAAAAVIGVVVGVLPDFSNLNAVPYRLASTARYVLVADDPALLFEAQEDGVGSALDMVDVGLNVDFVVGAGSTTTGQSGMQIDSSTVAATATLPLKLIRPVQRVDNELVAAGQANTRWMVKINNHQLAAHTGTAGV